MCFICILTVVDRDQHWSKNKMLCNIQLQIDRLKLHSLRQYEQMMGLFFSPESLTLSALSNV